MLDDLAGLLADPLEGVEAPALHRRARRCNRPPTIIVDGLRVGVTEPIDLIPNSAGHRRPLAHPEPLPRLPAVVASRADALRLVMIALPIAPGRCQNLPAAGSPQLTGPLRTHPRPQIPT